jgi:hypothetical protein
LLPPSILFLHPCSWRLEYSLPKKMNTIGKQTEDRVGLSCCGF